MKSIYIFKRRYFPLSPEPTGCLSDRIVQTEPTKRKNHIKSARDGLQSDPFRNIQKGSPNSKLKPIFIKKRISPIPQIKQQNESLRCPRVSLGLTRKKDPKAGGTVNNNSNLLGSDLPSIRLPRFFSEGILKSNSNLSPKAEGVNRKVFHYKNRFDISFGDINDSLSEYE